MKLTISALAIAATAFAGTFVFAPAVADLGQRLSFNSVVTASDSAPAEVAKVGKDCLTPVAKIADALSAKDCL